MLGYAFMGKAHSRALRALPRARPAAAAASSSRSAAATATPRRRSRPATAGRRSSPTGASRSPTSASSCSSTAARTRSTPRRRSLRRRRASTSSARSRSALDAGESHEMWRAAEDAGVVHACGFNYRFVPAIRARPRARRARALLGELVHFRARYLQSWGWDAPTDVWRFDRAQAGTGAIGDLGAHIVDLARYLVGEIESVSRARADVRRPGARSTTRSRPPSSLENGAIGTLEASRLARGRVNQNTFEINGSRRLDRVRPRALRRAARLRRRPVPGRARHRRLVAARPRARLGRHVHARVRAPRCARSRAENAVAPHGADVRGRLPRRRGLRRDPALGDEREKREDRVPMKTSLGIWAFGTMVDALRPGRLPAAVGRRDDRATKVRRAVEGLGDLIDGYEFHYPDELSAGEPRRGARARSASTTSTASRAACTSTRASARAASARPTTRCATRRSAATLDGGRLRRARSARTSSSGRGSRATTTRSRRRTRRPGRGSSTGSARRPSGRRSAA